MSTQSKKNFEIRNLKSAIPNSKSAIRNSLVVAVIVLAAIFSGYGVGKAQTRKPKPKPMVCGNPKIPCQTTAQFEPYDLPFRVAENAVITDTELFYAIMLKSVGKSDQDCEVFVPEAERLEAQALFPENKVFTSRCPDVETLAYTNVNPQHRFMAVYAGKTLAEAQRLLQTVKATNKFPGASIRRIRTGFNGT